MVHNMVLCIIGWARIHVYYFVNVYNWHDNWTNIAALRQWWHSVLYLAYMVGSVNNKTRGSQLSLSQSW